MLVTNTVNSVEKFGGQPFVCEQEEQEGLIRFTLEAAPTKETKLLLDSMLLGLSEVEREYGGTYFKLEFKEV